MVDEKMKYNSTSNTCTSLHYDTLAASSSSGGSFQDLYETLHTQDNIDLEVSTVIQYLHLLNGESSFTFADIGGGSGQFTEAVRVKFTEQQQQQAASIDPSSNTKWMVVEPSLATLQLFHSDDDKLEKVAMDALTFANSNLAKNDTNPPVSKILIRGTIHHIPDDELEITFSALYDLLSRNGKEGTGTGKGGGKILIMTRPYIPTFPLFDAARQVWMDNSQPLEKYITIAKRVGFHVNDDHDDVKTATNTTDDQTTASNTSNSTPAVPVSVPVLRLPVKMPLSSLFHLIRQRLWSTFSHFTNDELEIGIEELKMKYKSKSVNGSSSSCEVDTMNIEFNDEILLLVLSVP